MRMTVSVVNLPHHGTSAVHLIHNVNMACDSLRLLPQASHEEEVARLHSEAEAALAKALKDAEEKHNHHLANTITELDAANRINAKLDKDMQVRHHHTRASLHQCKVDSWFCMQLPLQGV